MGEEEIRSFIGASFRSVWSLELLCHLRRYADQDFSPDELITALRASDLVVQQSLADLMAGGLVVAGKDGRARYAPATEDLGRLASAAEGLYAKAPDAVRRIIVNAASPGLAAFANAFRLRGEKKP